MSVIRTLT